jgi:hypothetical protein
MTSYGFLFAFSLVVNYGIIFFGLKQLFFGLLHR